MARGDHEIIIVDDSSDEASSDASDDPGLRAVQQAALSKKASAKKPVVFGNFLITHEEKALMDMAEDESDASGDDEDDDYDDRDDSFGDGARAFARKRRRAPAGPAVDSKRRKTPTHTLQTPPTARLYTAGPPKKAPPPASRKPAPPRRGTMTLHHSDFEGSSEESVQEEEENAEEEDDRPFRHSSMVRKMEKAREMRTKLNGKQSKTKALPKQDMESYSGAKRSRESAPARKSEPSRAPVQPLVARKSAPQQKKKLLVLQSAKRSRRHVEDSDDYEDEESSEEESDDSGVEDAESDSDGRDKRRKPAHSRPIEEIEISDDDSSDEPESEEDHSRKRHSSTIKRSNGLSAKSTSVVPTKKLPPANSSKLPPKPKPKPAQPTPSKSQPRRASPELVPTVGAQRSWPDSTPAARPSRAVAALPENISVEEMQAQERELAYFRQMQKKKEQLSQQTNKSQSSRGRATSNNSRPPNTARKVVSTNSVHRLKRQDSVTSMDSTVSSVTAREVKPLHRSVSPLPFVPPALREGFSTTGTRYVLTTVSVATNGSMSFATKEKVDHIPIPHNTWWRERLQFVRAPLNILPADSETGWWQAFSRVKERELGEFDESGMIPPIIELASPPQLSTTELLAQSFESQESVNTKVRRVIDRTLPVLKQCHQRRVCDTISEMRKSLPWSKSASTQSRVIPQLEMNTCLDPAPIEYVHAKRIQHASLPRMQARHLNRLVGNICYVFGHPRTRRLVELSELEDAVFERPHFPETVVEFGEDLPPMRKTCAWISVKTNVHVEDDPILRYVPNLGDQERINIDPRRYISTTLDKEKAIVVDLPDEAEKQGDDVVKTQESLEVWRSDVANLVKPVRSAIDDEVMEYLLCAVIKECGQSDRVFKGLREVGGFAEPVTEYEVIQKREETARAVGKQMNELRFCLEGDNTLERIPAAQIRKYVSQLLVDSNLQSDDDSVSHSLRPPLTTFALNYVQNPTFKGLRRGNSVGQVMEWYRDLFCRRCYTYDCEQHGIQHPQPSGRTDPVNPVVRKAGVGLSRGNKLKSGDSNDVIEIDSSSSSSSEGDLSDHDNEDAQSTLSGSVDGEGETGDTADRRRSRRSQTRASTLASASLQVQEVMVEKERKKRLRKQAKQLQKLVRQVDDTEYLDDSYRVYVGPIMDSLLSPDSLCGPSCWKTSVSESSESTKELSEVAKLMVRKIIPILGDNPCILARLLQEPHTGFGAHDTDSCSSIHRHIQVEKEKTDGINLFSSAAYHDQFHDKSGHRRQSLQNRSSTAMHSGNREMVKRTRMNRAQQQTKEQQHRYQPCNHSGVCNDGNCDCLKRGHDCDKACSCSRECANRHHGCKCLPGQCRTKSCACYEAARECDPDFCFTCGAHEAAVMEYDDRQRFMLASDVNICRNVNMLRGVHKKIGVAFSATHGWGAYALEPIKKGEFVYEYTGALISDDEAERRGSFYDAMKVSYLFNINSDEVVDAMRKGNKIKFANHRTREDANLDTKILVVRGEHRIALFANWDIHVGEELFFDYGYTNETAPEWSQLRTPHNTRYADSDLEDDDEEVEELLRLQAAEEGLDTDDL